jgi:serine/threonine protein kinase
VSTEAPIAEGALVADRYRVGALLGQGGMGWVFRATDTLLDRPVAVKVMRHLGPTSVARFEREARVAARLEHPSVVRVHALGELPDGSPYLVLEFVRGRSLQAMVDEEGPLDEGEAVALLRPVVGALAEAHEAGIVHRDVKPENLVLQAAPGLPPFVRLLDFGIAAIESEDGARLTRTGQVFGTPETMAPEQALGRSVGPAADVWAIGVVLYTLLSGRSPFVGEHVPDVLKKVVDAPHPPLDGPVGPDVRALVDACLQKDPDARPRDGSALLAMFDGLAPAARPVPPPDPFAPSPEPTAAPPELADPFGADGSETRVDSPMVRDRGPASRASAPRLLAAVSAVIVLLLAVTAVLVVQDEAPPPPKPKPKPAAPAAAPPAVADALKPVEALLERGDGKAALAWLALHPDAGPAARRLLLRGIARLRTGATEDGAADVSAALADRPALADAPTLLPAVLAALESSKGDAAIPLITGRLAAAAEPALVELAGHRRYRTRWRAVKALEASGRDPTPARLAAYRRDTRAEDCEIRRRAVRQLGEIGDPSAIDDVRRAERGNFFANMCMDGDIQRAIRKLKAKQKAGADPDR